MNEASLRQVLAVLGARWGLIVVLSVPVLAASWGYAATLPPAYTATTVLSFAPVPGTDPGPSFTRLLPRYEITATTQQSLVQAEQAAGLSRGDLADAVVADLPSNTLELTLAVTSRDEQTSAAAARSLAQTVAETADDDPLVRVWSASEPDVAGDETPRRQFITVLAGHLLAPLPGAALALLLEGSRPRVRLPEDLHAAGVPVLQSSRPGGRSGDAGGGGKPQEVERSLHLMVARGLAHLRAVSPGSASGVAVISIDGPEDDADQVVEDLIRAAGDTDGHQDPGRLTVTSYTLPWPDPGAPEEQPGTPEAEFVLRVGSPEQAYVLVVRSGVPQDRVRAAVDLIRHQNGHILGGVLMTP